MQQVLLVFTAQTDPQIADVRLLLKYLPYVRGGGASTSSRQMEQLIGLGMLARVTDSGS